MTAGCRPAFIMKGLGPKFLLVFGNLTHFNSSPFSTLKFTKLFREIASTLGVTDVKQGQLGAALSLRKRQRDGKKTEFEFSYSQ